MSGKSAFTFVEILVIISIVTISVTFLLPTILSKKNVKNETESFFNKKIEESYNLARKLGKPVYISGFKGSSNIILPNGKIEKLPNGENILSVKINDNAVVGLKFYIGIYPQGICDYFELETDNNKKLLSIPLLMKTYLKL
jgi:type II secretory pathway pseudopilin PulG